MNFYIKKIGILFVAVFLFFGFYSCNFFVSLSEKEEIFVILPKWPPSDSFSDGYPNLSRWEIDFYSCEKRECFYTNDKFLSYTVNKNEPFCITAKPITYAFDGNSFYETSFFYAAGTVYPYSKNEDCTMFLKWEDGFAAECMKKIIKSKDETDISYELLIKFVESFNWKKMIEEIEKKIFESVENDDVAMYNPWLLDSQKVLKKLSEKQFSASYLNLLGYSDFDFSEEINSESDYAKNKLILFSKFVLENEYLYKKKKIKLKNGENNYLTDCYRFEMIITLDSEKKLSKETVLLPIYFERL